MAATVRPRVFEFEVTVDRDRVARSALGGSALPREEAWTPEHLVLAGLVRCTLASMDYAARRAGATCVGSGSAHGVVTRREEDGRYAFVEIDASFEVELDPAPPRDGLADLVAKAEAGCFVGNSLAAKPRYRWTINGEALP
ncbi:MAG: OsmC family protein [Thermoleophilia bacterium]|nr:OsmC family protein [Thermoleophilia bacterium]